MTLGISSGGSPWENVHKPMNQHQASARKEREIRHIPLLSLSLLEWPNYKVKLKKRGTFVDVPGWGWVWEGMPCIVPSSQIL